jgi:hypothetical protein
MKKIVFVGAAGCGKSTLTASVFVELKKRGYNTELVDEWIRREIQMNGVPNIWEQYRVYHTQKSIEDSLPSNVEFAIIDAGVLSPYFYSFRSDLFDERVRHLLNDMYRYFINDLYLKRYDYIFYLPVSHTYDKHQDLLRDGTRFQTREDIDVLDTHMRLHFTKLHKLDNIYTLDCELEKRTDTVLKIILNSDVDKK